VEYKEFCADGGTSVSHDFGTTDLTTLARATAFISQPGAPEMVNQTPIFFDGSVGTVACPTAGEIVTFVLEP
jgi:hypothetical protein